MNEENLKVVAGYKCMTRTQASEYVGMSLSTFDKAIRLTKSKKMKVPLRFIQYARTAPIYFPVIWLDDFVKAVAEAGRAF